MNLEYLIKLRRSAHTPLSLRTTFGLSNLSSLSERDKISTMHNVKDASHIESLKFADYKFWSCLYDIMIAHLPQPAIAISCNQNFPESAVVN